MNARDALITMQQIREQGFGHLPVEVLTGYGRHAVRAITVCRAQDHVLVHAAGSEVDDSAPRPPWGLVLGLIFGAFVGVMVGKYLL